MHQHDAIERLAQLGVTVLPFLVGLKLDPALVRSLGALALATAGAVARLMLGSVSDTLAQMTTGDLLLVPA